MKKSEAYVAQGELAKSQQSDGEKLESPVRLTREQLEIVAGGFMAQISLGTGGKGDLGSTATTGAYPPPPPPVFRLL